jgi:transposase
MIVVGVDTHKRTHALAAVDADTGQLLGEREVAATEQGHLDGLRWAHELGQEIAWAIEDCRHVSQRFERSLVSAGERVLRVAPKLMGASRRGEREPGKSDQIDARAIARAVLRDGIERFPAAFLDEQAVEIRLLCDHREILVAERARLINRLRWNLVVLDPELEAKIPSRKLDYPGQLQRITRRLRTLPQTARVRVAREQVKRIAALTREAEALKRELRDLIRRHRPELLAETGCGPLCAAILIGQTAGAERFASDAHFARMAGRRSDTRILRAPRPPPPTPRRQPPAQPRTSRHCDHTWPDRPRDPCLPRSQGSRGLESHRGDALPQAPPRQALSSAALFASTVDLQRPLPTATFLR